MLSFWHPGGEDICEDFVPPLTELFCDACRAVVALVNASSKPLIEA